MVATSLENVANPEMLGDFKNSYFVIFTGMFKMNS